MSNIITPLNNIDFSAAIAEITPLLENQLVEMPKRYTNSHSDIYMLLSSPADLPVTNAILASMNVSMLNPIYIEAGGGVEHYQRAEAHSCIVLPLEVTGTTVGAYSVPLETNPRLDRPTAYHKEDCTLIESHHSVDSPVFIGIEADGFELAIYFDIPADKTLKSIVIMLNEDTIAPTS